MGEERDQSTWGGGKKRSLGKEGDRQREGTILDERTETEGRSYYVGMGWGDKGKGLLNVGGENQSKASPSE